MGARSYVPNEAVQGDLGIFDATGAAEESEPLAQTYCY